MKLTTVHIFYHLCSKLWILYHNLQNFYCLQGKGETLLSEHTYFWAIGPFCQTGSRIEYVYAGVCKVHNLCRLFITSLITCVIHVMLHSSGKEPKLFLSTDALGCTLGMHTKFVILFNGRHKTR